MFKVFLNLEGNLLLLELNFKNVLLDVININMVFMFLNYIEIDMFLVFFK